MVKFDFLTFEVKSKDFFQKLAVFLILLLVTINVECKPIPSQSKYSENYQNPGCATQMCNYEYPEPEKSFELPPPTTQPPEPGIIFIFLL